MPVSPPSTTLYRLLMKNICAGVVANDLGIIVRAAPILDKFRGQHIDRLREWAHKNNGEVKEVTTYEAGSSAL